MQYIYIQFCMFNTKIAFTFLEIKNKIFKNVQKYVILANRQSTFLCHPSRFPLNFVKDFIRKESLFYIDLQGPITVLRAVYSIKVYIHAQRVILSLNVTIAQQVESTKTCLKGGNKGCCGITLSHFYIIQTMVLRQIQFLFLSGRETAKRFRMCRSHER